MIGNGEIGELWGIKQRGVFQGMRGIDCRKNKGLDGGMREGMAMVGEGKSCKKDLRLIRRVLQSRGGIAEGTIREFKNRGEL